LASILTGMQMSCKHAGRKERQPKPGQGSGGGQLPDIIKKSTAFDERRKKSWRKPGEKKNQAARMEKMEKEKRRQRKIGKNGKDGNGGSGSGSNSDSHESNENNAKEIMEIYKQQKELRSTSR
jgi:hypothetical protein